ncbi:FKBP-type peptidyl-prolyl cis-trans isomerase [Marinilabilia rubra]|uniref:Peptidyl-prolyl cis-trans isomerase n=1 Tax=Marinilabilia rubra TaxID=2162893 RepID=A0A2U2B6S6_9BACT|nr:FKBP-type peptidyl-prolyl cis-trans isomerase [Marinilabilia rubra]PWD98743.1 peptidylprolyl isomerase [Marinilabilia rubra]
MKVKHLAIGLIAASFFASACNRVPHTGEANMETELDSLSYALGFIEANSWKERVQQAPFDTLDFKQVALAFKDANILDRYMEFRKNQFDTLNVAMFKKGFFNEVAYDKSYFTDMTADVYVRKIFQKNKEKRDSQKKADAAENLKKGQAFLDENALKDGVISTESGLQYKVIEEGDGPVPTPEDRVKCTYHGTLIDGTVFDSSVERGDTASFRVKGVIKGWQEALTMMPVGAKWKLYIPSDLAYGQNGAGTDIGPNETIMFEVELIDIIESK